MKLDTTRPSLGCNARAVGVEDARDLDPQLVLAVVIEEQRLGAALAFVVAGAHADRVDVAPVVFGLRMDVRVAVHRRNAQFLRENDAIPRGELAELGHPENDERGQRQKSRDEGEVAQRLSGHQHQRRIRGDE